MLESQRETAFVTNFANRRTLRIELGSRGYEIVIATGELGGCAAAMTGWLEERGLKPTLRSAAVIITDANVRTPHAAAVEQSLTEQGWTVRVASVPAGENSKSQVQVSALYDVLVDLPADRQTVIVAVGGGVVGDLAGFVAATYARGLPFVQVPTTLLAQVDSSVGGKVGINHPRGKNLIGAFHQPLGVWLDTAVLETLPEREYRSGLAEVVKYGVILDAEFFEQLEQNVGALLARDAAVLRRVVARCCELKGIVVEQDEFERTGLRAVLNYGHTFGHAFEALAGYGQLLHGEAVAIGMMYAARLAARLGRVDGAFCARQQHLLAELQLPVELPGAIMLAAEDVVAAMRLDKKTQGGQLRFVLPTRLGHVETVRDVPEAIVLEVLAQGLAGRAV